MFEAPKASTGRIRGILGGLRSFVSYPRGPGFGRKWIWCKFSTERIWRQRIRYRYFVFSLCHFTLPNARWFSSETLALYKSLTYLLTYWHVTLYTTFKAGQNRDRIRNSWQFSVLKNFVIFPGQAVNIWDCPEKIWTDGPLTFTPYLEQGSLPAGTGTAFPKLFWQWERESFVTLFLNTPHRRHIIYWSLLISRLN